MDSVNNGLKELLNDINHFLSQTLRGESLSEYATAEKEALLCRLASQLSPAYLDMNGTSKGLDQVEEYVDAGPLAQDQEVEGECYEEFPDKQQHPNSLQLEEDKSLVTVDYENISLPFSKLRQEANMFGCLYRKEKFLFIDHSTRCWAGIKHDMLLIYSSEKDTKPSSTLLLRHYTARSCLSYYSKDPKKKECCFAIVCPGKKTHQFIAPSVKDKERWISAVNDVHQKQSSLVEESENTRVAVKTPLNSNGVENEEVYDDISAHNSQYYNEEIYHDIPELFPELCAEKTEVSPLRRRPVPSIPNQNSSDSDSVYDDVDNAYPNSLYYNCPDKKGQPSVEPQLCDPETQPLCEEEYVDDEYIYDDIGILDRLGTHKGPFNQEGTSSQGRIQHIIQKITSLGNIPKPNTNNVNMNYQTSDSNIPNEEFYEPIDISEEGVVPPKANHVRY
ncbi:src kinase-associated phosphoprotein 2 [Anabrus simplex]|uniref:src kinase-associated phosphoprotein 2 n=1 Tax=Anabrus simplex TaxID=316456 RepID=UPI0034DCF806